MVQCRQDTNCREEGGGDVANRSTDTYRGAVRFTRDADDTTHALNNHIVCTLLRIGPGLPETRARGVDKRRMFNFQRVVIQPQFLHRPRTEILNKDIGLLQQLLEYCLSTLGFKVERHALLPTIHAHEIETEPIFEGTEISRFVSCTGLFNLDDLCPEVTEEHGRIRTCEYPR